MVDVGVLEAVLNIEDYLGSGHLDPYPALKARKEQLKSWSE